MSKTDPDEIIDAVLTHRDVLNALRSGPKTKSELEDACEVSRSTIDRWISRLETVGLLHRPGDRFELTLFGRIATYKFTRLRSQITQLEKLREPLTMHSEEIDLQAGAFETATISVHESATELAENLLAQPGTVRLITPYFRTILSVLGFRDADPDTELEVIIEEEMLSQLDHSFISQQLPLFSAAGITVYEITETPPFGLALVEHGGRTIVSLIFKNSNTDTGVIEFDSPEAVAWGETVYHQYRDGAVERRWPRVDQPFTALRDDHHRDVLLELLHGNVEHETDAMMRGNAGEDDSPRSDDPLLALAETEYVEWDRDTGEIRKGPRFDEIRPVLELLADHAGVSRE